MKSSLTAFTFLVAGSVIGLIGCGTSAQPRFYTLNATAAAPSTSGTKVLVGPVSIPATVDRPEMVVQNPPNGVEIEEFNRWASPLGEMIGRAVASDLGGQLMSSEVTSAPLASFNPSYKVTINVQRFDSIRGQEAVLEAVWTVQDMSASKSRSGSTAAHEAIQGDGFDAIAAAQSRALARLSSDIAAVIRTASN
ncbi:MAG TPA: PqiC family protein [Candidatus Binataceae bacterium]|nr:PqiC family protein [Candidatus Binataceae bacterium]